MKNNPTQQTPQTLESVCGLPPGSFETYMTARNAAGRMASSDGIVSLTAIEVSALFEVCPELEALALNASS